MTGLVLDEASVLLLATFATTCAGLDIGPTITDDFRARAAESTV